MGAGYPQPYSASKRAQHIDNILLRLNSTDPCAPLLHMLKSRLTSSEAQPFSRRTLGLLVKSCLAFQATDPKDKVYGVLGLLSPRSPAQLDKQEPLLDVDYNKSVAEIYVDMTMYLLLTFQHLGVLELHIPSTSNTHHLPSWVFNFESPPTQMLQASSITHTYGNDPPPGTLAPGIRCYNTHGRVSSIASHSPVLVAHGHSVGTIRTVDQIPDSTYWRRANIAFRDFNDNFPNTAEFFPIAENLEYRVNPLVHAGDTVVYLYGGLMLFALRPIASASDRTELPSHRARDDHQYYEFLGAIPEATWRFSEHRLNSEEPRKEYLWWIGNNYVHMILSAGLRNWAEEEFHLV